MDGSQEADPGICMEKDPKATGSPARRDSGYMLSYLTELNDGLADIIRRTSKMSLGEWGSWRIPANGFKPVRCYEEKDCSKQECPAFQNDDYRCWLVKGTLCASSGDVLGTTCDAAVPSKYKYDACQNCDVFRRVTDDPLRSLYEHITILMYQMKWRADEFSERATRDHLTGLHNRMFFNDVIDREMARLRRSDEALSLVMVDVDNFKDINDAHGHHTGDEVLVAVAQMIKMSIRQSDMAFRYGGDEFLVMLHNAQCDTSSIVVDRILSHVAGWNAVHGAGKAVTVSLSFGCSFCDGRIGVVEALHDADTAMYRHKRSKQQDD